MHSYNTRQSANAHHVSFFKHCFLVYINFLFVPVSVSLALNLLQRRWKCLGCLSRWIHCCHEKVSQKFHIRHISWSRWGELFTWASYSDIPAEKLTQCSCILQNSTPNSSKSLSKAPPPLIPVANGLRPDNLSSHKGVGRNGLDKQRLVDTPAFRPDPTRQEPPYKVRKVCTQLFFLYVAEVLWKCYSLHS